jgi:hypothetical protein
VGNGRVPCSAIAYSFTERDFRGVLRPSTQQVPGAPTGWPGRLAKTVPPGCLYMQHAGALRRRAEQQQAWCCCSRRSACRE